MTDPDETALAAMLRAEVEALHDFLAAWFRGEVAQDRALFDAELAAHLAEGMTNIQPAGRALSRDSLLRAVFDGHGSNASFRIEIRDFTLVAVSKDRALAVATYVERQTGAKNTTPPDNARVSTAVFRLDDAGRRATWLHLQETACP